jgi:phosphatidylglycerol:prolipoprotein diacylglycerol transferase
VGRCQKPYCAPASKASWSNVLTFFRNIFAAPRDLILVVIALWIGLWLAEKRSARHGIPANDLNNLTFFPLLAYLLGGRLLYALENLPAFTQAPVSLFSLNLVLFDPLGGSTAALLVAWAYIYRRRLSLWSALDALTPLFAALAVGMALAHLATGNAFGKETSLPWGIELWGALRHPSQAYECLAAGLTLGLLWSQKALLRPGLHFLTFSTATSAYRVFLEAFRGDSTLLAGGFRLEQILAWCVLAASLFFINRILGGHPAQEGVSGNG